VLDSYVGREVNTLGVITHGQSLRGANHVLTKDSGTNHVRVNLWLTLYKLTGWLASLDTTRTTPVASSATEQCSPMPCMMFGFGRGEG